MLDVSYSLVIRKAHREGVCSWLSRIYLNFAIQVPHRTPNTQEGHQHRLNLSIDAYQIVLLPNRVTFPLSEIYLLDWEKEA
jgi:hypothetical protein